MQPGMLSFGSRYSFGREGRGGGDHADEVRGPIHSVGIAFPEPVLLENLGGILDGQPLGLRIPAARQQRN